MTPAVDGRSAMSRGREEGSAETLVVPQEVSTLKKPVFKNLLTKGESDSVQSRGSEYQGSQSQGPVGSNNPVEYGQLSSSISESPEDSLSVDPVSQAPIDHPANISVPPTLLKTEVSAAQPTKSVAIERGKESSVKTTFQATASFSAEQDVVRDIVENQVVSQQTLSATGQSQSLSTDVDLPGPVITASEVVEAPVEVFVTPGKVAQLPVTSRTSENNIASANVSRIIGLPVESPEPTAVATDSVISEVGSAPDGRSAILTLKNESKPVPTKERFEINIVPVKKTSNVESRSRLKGVALDNMPLVEYRNTNQTPLPVQPLSSEVTTQLVAVGMATDTSHSVKLDTGLTNQQAPLRLQSTLVHNATGHIKMMVSRGIGRAAVQLNPADLGAMHINIDLKADQLTVQISVAQSATREVMEAALPKLREQLQAEGYSEITIDLDSDNAGEQRDGGMAQNNPGFQRGVGADIESTDLQKQQGVTAAATKSNLIDLFA